MTISPTTRNLSEPEGRNKIPEGTFAYLRVRNRMRLFTLVKEEFARAGITKAILAERLGKGADQVNHWLAVPHNWTLDTLSDLLFAISGAVLSPELARPARASEQRRRSEVLELEAFRRQPSPPSTSSPRAPSQKDGGNAGNKLFDLSKLLVA